MTQDRVNKLVLLVLVLSVSALFLWMIREYLMALFMAALFSALLMPAFRWLSRKLGGRERLASILLILATFLLVLVPFTILGGIVVTQAVNVGQSVTPKVQELINKPSAQQKLLDSTLSTVNRALEKVPGNRVVAGKHRWQVDADLVSRNFKTYQNQIIAKLGQAVGMISGFLVNSLSSLTSMTLNALMGVVIMLYSMFFLLVSGGVLLRKILFFLPLVDEDERLLLHRFTSVTAATLKGTLIIGIVQGAICGTGFALAGIGQAVFWGAVMAVLSIIPALGTAIVWFPAAIILLAQGHYGDLTILLIVCGLIAGNVDNLLRPRLVGKDTEMHELFVLFSTLGGLSMFGILGIIVGPIIAALFITLWELYGKAFAAYLPEVGVGTLTREQRGKRAGQGKETQDVALPAISMPEPQNTAKVEQVASTTKPSRKAALPKTGDRKSHKGRRKQSRA